MSRRKGNVELSFPQKGVNVVVSRVAQSLDTCVNAKNVRVFDVSEGRGRGGIRPGLSKFNSNTVDGSNRIQDLNHVTLIANTDPSSGSLGVREVKEAVVSNGTIAHITSSSINTASTSGAQSLSNTADFILSTEFRGRIYYTDGISYKVWVGSNNTAIDWTESAGSLPGTDGTRTPRIIETWRGRIVLTGLANDDGNWFMSALDDPDDWDTNPSEFSVTQALAGGVGVVGKIGDVINAFVPCTDDVALFGGDHTIWRLVGDPGEGGRLRLLSDAIGMAFGRPWAKDESGRIYFMATNGNVYRTDACGSTAPQSMTQNNIAPEIEDIDFNTTFVRLLWDDRRYGLHVFLSPLSTGSATHWYWDLRSTSWWRHVHGNNNHNPIAVDVFDGDDPDDREILLGSEDGIVRKFDDSSADDDGTDIESFVVLGPIQDQQSFRPLVVRELQAILDVNSTPIKYEIVAGDTPEEAVDKLSANFTADGVLNATERQTHFPRERGAFVYIKVGNTSSTGFWAMERVRAGMSLVESSRGRRLVIE